MSRRMVFGWYDYAGFSAFTIYAASSVVIPVVLIELARSLGFPLDDGGMGAGGVLHATRSIALTAAMLLCGFVAGRWGKRRSLGWSILIVGFGIVLCSMTSWYSVLLLALLIAGFGEGIVEGLATPYVQDLHPDDPGRYINFSHGFWALGVAGSVIIVGALLNGGINWRLIVFAFGAASLIPALLLLLPNKNRPAEAEHSQKAGAGEIIASSLAIFRNKHFWLFFVAMFFAGGGEFCLTFWVASFVRLDLGGSALSGGLATAIFSIGMLVGRWGWGYLIRQKYLKHLLIFSGLGGIFITAFFPFLKEVFGTGNMLLYGFYGLLFLAGLAEAPYWPSIQSYCVEKLPELDSTMIFIYLSCAGVPGCGVFTLLMGVAGDKLGLSYAMLMVPCCILIMTLLLVIERTGKRQKV